MPKAKLKFINYIVLSMYKINTMHFNKLKIIYKIFVINCNRITPVNTLHWVFMPQKSEKIGDNFSAITLLHVFMLY